MSKNNLIGIILIGIVLIAYSVFFNNPSEEQLPQQQTQEQQATNATSANLSTTAPEQMEQNNAPHQQIDSIYLFSKLPAAEKSCTLQNEKIAVTFSTIGAQPVSAQLKGHKSYTGESLHLFKKGDASLSFPLRTSQQRIIDTHQLPFEMVALTDSTVSFKLPFTEQEYMLLSYTLAPNSYMVDINVDLSHMGSIIATNLTGQDFEWLLNMPRQERSWKYENQYANIYYKFPSGDVEDLNAAKASQEKDVREPLKWVGFADKYFSTVLIAQGKNRLENNRFAFTTADSESDYIKNFSHTGTFSMDLARKGEAKLSLFVGPLQYKMLKELDEGKADGEKLRLDKMVYLGASIFRWINVFLIIPIVDFLKIFISNWGIIILLLTLIIKTILSPLTFKSYMSQAKMRVLKPQVEAINARYPGQDQKMMLKRSQETMALYRSAGVNQLSGCLPMLMQMPFLIALYMYFPTAIDLRGESFLWAQDLSTFDDIIRWDAEIPIISSLIGNHISLFCLLWCVTSIFYTKYTMNMSGGGMDSPQMKPMRMMPYIMTIMFFFFFNSQASGLTYYYLISTVITILQFLASRALINEEKVLAKLEENKKKPRKKSGFMARLEQMQKEQEKMMREQRNKR